MNTRSFLNHEVLNLMTLVQMLVLSEPLSQSTKTQVINLIKLSSLLISNPSFFESQKKEVFLEEVDLREVIEVPLLIHEEEIKKEKVSISLFSETILVKADKNLLKDVLDVILKALLRPAERIKLIFDEGVQKLKIEYSGKVLQLKRMNPMDLLKERLPAEETVKHLMINLAISAGMEIGESGKSIEISFPRKASEKLK